MNLDNIWPLIWVTAIAGMGGTGLGGVVACLFRKESDKAVSLLLSFAAGVMTAVVCFDLLTEALNTGDRVHLWLVASGVLFGYTIISVMNRWIDRATNHEEAQVEVLHAKAPDSLDELTRADNLNAQKKNNQPRNELFRAGLVMAAAIALHNMPEGMVIGVSFAASKAQVLANRGGLAIAIVIGLHNIPEGMAVAVPLISGGMKKWKAVALTASSGFPTVLGAVIGYLIGAISKAALIISLSFASGAMLYVVFGELLPESILKWRTKEPALAAVLGLLTGLIIVYI